MRYGINTCLWSTGAPNDATLPGLVEQVVAAGADWIEVPLYADEDSLSLVAARNLIRRNRLAVSVTTGLWPHEDLTDPDEVVGRRGIAALATCIERAAVLGAVIVAGAFHATGGVPGWRSEAEREAAIDRLCDRLLEVARIAERHAVVLCVEPLNRYEASLLNTTAQGLEVIRRVGHASLGLLLDTFHMNIEDPVVGDAIRLAGPSLRHVHANESHRGVPGTGRLDWHEIRVALDDIGYQGALVLEAFDPSDQANATGGRAWRPHVSSADLLAARSVSALRRLVYR